MNYPAKGVHPENEWFFRWLPYQFEKRPHPRFKHVYLPLNRRNQPLGLFDREPRNLDHGVVFDVDPHTFKGVWLRIPGLYLYGNSPESFEGYGARMNNLMLKPMRLLGEIRE